MKPPRFDYRRLRTLEELTGTLRQHGDEAQILAGGQSLMPMLNMRVARPEVLLDINGISALSRIEAADGRVILGALTRHRTLEDDPEIAARLPLLALAAPHIAHPAVRNRGTIGGSLALADPAAELPALTVCLDAEIRLASAAGGRRIAARDFFLGTMTTAVRPDEAIAAIDFPASGPDDIFVFQEITRRHGDFAIAGIAARATRTGRGLRSVAVTFFGIGTHPALSPLAARLIEANDTAIPVAEFRTAIAEEIEIVGDESYPASYRLTLAATLAHRAAAELHRKAAA